MARKSTYTSALSPEYALLGLVWQQPDHGYELHQRLVEDLGQIWHISLSQTYNILNRLEARGYISGTTQEQDKLPDRRQFDLTEAGRQRFEAWLHEPSGSSVRAIRVEFMTRLYFAHGIDRELADKIIETQISETRAGLSRLKALLSKIPEDRLFNRLGLELRVRQLASILDWLNDCQWVLAG
jgi:DNA-binding PadR family transcriptional regulator